MAKQATSYLPSKSGPKIVPWLWSNDKWFETYPALYQLLAAGIDEGDERKPATLTIFVSEGRLKATVHDRHTRQRLWLTLEGDIDLLREIEALIVSKGGEWRPDKAKGDMEGVL
jgi:hypothetical protein